MLIISKMFGLRVRTLLRSMGYSDTDKAIRNHIDEEDKFKGPAKTAEGWQLSFFINESGFYSLVLSSKLETALGNITSQGGKLLPIHSLK